MTNPTCKSTRSGRIGGPSCAARRVYTRWAIVLGTLAALTACGDQGPAPAPAASSSPARPTAEAPTEFTPEQLERAMADKVRFFGNTLPLPVRAVSVAQHRYEAYAEAHMRDGVLEAPEGDETPFGPEIAIPDGFFGQLEAASGTAPSMPELEASLPAYQRTLTEVVDRIAEARAYYETREYETDEMARGRALHTSLMEAFAAFREASDASGMTLHAAHRRLRDRVLSQLEQDPERRTAFLVETAFAAAEDALDVVRRGELDEEQRLRGIERDALTEGTARLRTTQRALAAHATTQAEGTPDGTPELAAVVEALAAQLNILVEMERHLEGEPWDSEASQAIAAGRRYEASGTPSSLVRAHMTASRAAAAWRSATRPTPPANAANATTGAEMSPGGGVAAPATAQPQGSD